MILYGGQEVLDLEGLAIKSSEVNPGTDINTLLSCAKQIKIRTSQLESYMYFDFLGLLCLCYNSAAPKDQS